MPGLKTHIWAGALLRRVQGGGAAAYVTRRGDPDAGVVLVKLSLLDGTARLYAPARDDAGERAWRVMLDRAPEAEADALLLRETSYDPDAWIVEIEDRQGRHFLTEPILEI